MTPISVEAPLRSVFVWTIKERHGNLWVPVLRRKNLQTNFGLTAYAGAFAGNYTAPQWLVLNTDAASLSSLSGLTLTLSKAVHVAGDTQLVLGLGLSTQETLNFTSVSGSVYTLASTPVNAHSAGESVCRNVAASDTLACVLGEVQFDSANFPNQRAQTTGGYSSGTGNYIMQFFLTGTQGLAQFSSMGLADSLSVGAGSLHNHFISGFNHQANTDLEIDVSITLINS